MRTVNLFIIFFFLSGCLAPYKIVKAKEDVSVKPQVPTIKSNSKPVSWFNDPDRKPVKSPIPFDYYVHPQTVQYGLVGQEVEKIKMISKAQIDGMIKEECAVIANAAIEMYDLFMFFKEENIPIIDANSSVAQIIGNADFKMRSFYAFPYGSKTMKLMMDIAMYAAKIGEPYPVNSIYPTCVEKMGYEKYQDVATNPKLNKTIASP